MSALWLWRLQLDCGACSWIAEITVWLQRSHLDCGDCSHQDTVGLTNCICKLPNFCNLSNQTAISAIRVQSQQSDCNPPELQLDYTDWFELQNRTAILYHATSPTRGGMTNRICKLKNICNLSNPTAISAIRLQSSWIAVRLHRLIWIAKQNCNPISRNLPDTRWDDQPYM